MPSTNKTANLRLNSWIGADKPKKDDFNNDNKSIDQAYGQMNQAITEIKGTAAGDKTALQQSISQVDGRCTTISGSLNTHIANAVAHITASERTAWNGKDSLKIGTYAGTGSATNTVNMGFKPRFGAVFASGKGVVEMDFTMQEMYVHAGFFGTGGCSKNLSLTDTGIQVLHNAIAPGSGNANRFNDSGVTYVWVAWK